MQLPAELKQIASWVGESIHVALSPLAKRVDAVEARQPIPGPAGRDGRDGKDVDPSVVKALVTEAVSALPAPKEGAVGQKGDRGDVGPVGPKGEKGDKGDPGEPGPTGQTGEIGPVGQRGEKGDTGQRGEIGPIGQKGDTGPAGKDADPLLLKSLQDELTRLREEVIVLKSMPVPKDGRNGIDGAKGDPGESITSALIDKAGSLLLTFSDGTVKEVGVVVGKDGTNGINGKDGAPGPSGKDGIGIDGKDGADGLNGKDGRDGLGFDDLDVAFDEQSGVVLRFARGSDVKEFPIAVPFDAGVWRSGVTYPKGAGVTVKGAFFIAREKTQTRPDDGTIESARAWRLAVKGGRDGKPGKDGKDGGHG